MSEVVYLFFGDAEHGHMFKRALALRDHDLVLAIYPDKLRGTRRKIVPVAQEGWAPSNHSADRAKESEQIMRHLNAGNGFDQPGEDVRNGRT
jgi:hypothetical protein